MSAWWEELLAGGAGIAAGLATANPMVGLGVWQTSRSALDVVDDLWGQDAPKQQAQQPANGNPYGVGSEGYLARLGQAREGVNQSFNGAEHNAMASLASRGMVGGGQEAAARNAITASRGKAMAQAVTGLQASETANWDNWNRWKTGVDQANNQANMQAWGNAALGLGTLGARFGPDLYKAWQDGQKPTSTTPSNDFGSLGLAKTTLGNPYPSWK